MGDNKSDSVKGKSSKKELKSGKPRLLRDDILEIDSTILNLLLKRHNILQKLRDKGKIAAADEKIIREAWQASAGRLSKDPELTSRFFALMQGIKFLPKPDKTSGLGKRDAFNLAPPKLPVKISLPAPLDSRLTRAWLYLASCAGTPVTVAPTLQNTDIVDCVKSLAQMGAYVSRLHETVPGREYEVISIKPCEPLGRPDTVIHTGESSYNFYLFLCHYLGGFSRAKFTGNLQGNVAEFTALRHALPELGARLTSIIPKSMGLPARVECSGVLPPGFNFNKDLPCEFGECLILAAIFYPAPFTIDFSDSPHKDRIFGIMLPLLDNIGAAYALDNNVLCLTPCSPVLPEHPLIPVQTDVASFLLALTMPLQGEANLNGEWPKFDALLWDTLKSANLPWQTSEDLISSVNKTSFRAFNINNLPQEILRQIDRENCGGFTPLITSLSACAALAGGAANLPAEFFDDPNVLDFLRTASLEPDENGNLKKAAAENGNPVWNAPTPQWAMALALAACARSDNAGFRLGNPGVMAALWPPFWSIYNSLPAPRPRPLPVKEEVKKQRRRIITNVVATPPEIKEEDWN